ncbi:TrmH family RNA methyltransferase [Blattabacterium cuenoti]|uniref:TrmH family RNA methyltransferase n=1 Tax=Blattabacterium cuenoti TaxID=1653831 RepID=UPI00163B8071|nr:TrmH family RNA methyltransferase [Blattabacterium cuenoti]
MKILHNILHTDIKLKRLKKKKKFLVEGIREFKMAIKGNFIPIQIFICNKIFTQFYLIKNYRSIVNIINIKKFRRLAYRDNSDGIIVIFEEKPFNRLENYNIKKDYNNYLVLILDGIEKPGNLGAILRIAESAKFDIVILCNIKTYIFNPNVIRCSLGSVFTNNIIIEKIEYVLYWMKKNKFQIIVSGFKNNSNNLYDVNFPISNISIVFGSENKGVSNIWMKKAFKIIKIPMFGNIDSLNVNSAMSIITYEIIRQKFFSH